MLYYNDGSGCQILFEDRPCVDCGGKKLGSYERESYCGPCLNKRRKVLREKKALLKGAKPRAVYGSGRLNLCSKCGKEKDKSFLSSGYCRECTNENRKAKTLAKRLDAGLTPWGSGLLPKFCYNCKEVKEVQKDPFCRKCRNEKAREKRKLDVKNKPNFRIEERKKHILKLENDPNYRFKKYVRGITYHAIKKGFLIPKPCEVCEKVKVDAHHDDYTKPLDVRWLCRYHHVEHHWNELTQ